MEASRRISKEGGQGRGFLPKNVKRSSAVQLNFANRELHGRTHEIQVLQNALDYCLHSKGPFIVFVNGPSGVGKSSLIAKLQELVPDAGHYVSGKFEQRAEALPFSAIANACTELCHSIEESQIEGIRQKMNEGAQDPTIFMHLANLVPEFQHRILGNAGDSGSLIERSAELNTAFEQLKVSFRQFLRAVCMFAAPVVFAIDDLHWADSESMALITSLAIDDDISGLLIVGTYRSENSKEKYPLMVQMKQVVAKHKDPDAFNSIELGNLSLNHLNEFIVKLTSRNREDCVELAKTVFAKTNGNPFFAVQFLQMLQNDRFLYFSRDTFEWTWDTETIQSETSITDNVVDLIANSLRMLPLKTQNFLMFASCLGTRFNVSTVWTVFLCLKEDYTSEDNESGVTENVSDILQPAIKEGLIIQCDDTLYRFSHDKICEGAYSLFANDNERRKVHWSLGTAMMKISTRKRMPSSTPIAVRQLNRGIGAIENPETRLMLATLNLTAAKLLIEKSAFLYSSNFLITGIALLSSGQEMWSQHYDLALDLHSTLAEMQFNLGDFTRCFETIDQVLRFARSVKDTQRVTVAKLDALSSKGDSLEGIKFGLRALKQLKIRISKHPSPLAVALEFLKVRSMFNKFSFEALLDQEMMADNDNLMATKILNILNDLAFFTQNHNLHGMICLQMTKLTLLHGSTEYSAFAFVLYSFILGKTGDLAAAHRTGCMALDLAKGHKSKKIEARVSMVMQSFINHIRRPIVESLDSCLKSYYVGMQVGDITYAAFNAYNYCLLYTFTGLPLAPLSVDMQSFLDQLTKYNQCIAQTGIEMYHRFIRGMMGNTPNPLIFTGTGLAFTEEEYLVQCQVKRVELHILTFYFLKMWAAYIFQDYDLALKCTKVFWKRPANADGSAAWAPLVWFFTAMTYLESQRQAHGSVARRHWRRRGLKTIKLLERWVEVDKVLNCQHKLLIIYAEKDRVAGKKSVDEIKAAYDLAISACTRSGFLQDNALANERAANFAMEHLDEDWAEHYQKRSFDLYVQWNATAKVEQMKNTFRYLSDRSMHAGSSRSFRGRQRFSATITDFHFAGLDSILSLFEVEDEDEGLKPEDSGLSFSVEDTRLRERPHLPLNSPPLCPTIV